MSSPSLETKRLILRPWIDGDFPAFAALNADPRVREFYPDILTRAQSDESALRIQQSIEEKGYGLWAVEVKDGPSFIGYVGLSSPGFEAPFTPCIEIGWRLAHAHWGKGYATEAARVALDFGFRTLGLSEIVSFTVPANQRSIAVMERTGMSRNPADDFEHPLVPEGHPLKKHILYRLTAPNYREEKQ